MEEKDNIIEGRKLISALYELTKENLNLSDDTILDKLYVHISKNASENDFITLLADFNAWLESVLKIWNMSTLCDGVKVFSIRLIGLVASKPQGFTVIKGILPEIERLISSSDVHTDSRLMVPLVYDLELFLNHAEGLDWVLNTGIWKHAVKLFFEDRSIYINRSGIEFIAALLMKLGYNNKNKCVEIITFICKPLVDQNLLSIKPLLDLNAAEDYLPLHDRDTNNTMSVKEGYETKHIARAAKYLCDLIEKLFSKNATLPVLFQFNPIRNNDFLKNCLSPQDYQTTLQLLVMVLLSNSCRSDTYRCYPTTNHLFSLLQEAARYLIVKGHYSNLMDICVFCLCQIHRIRDRVIQHHNFPDCMSCRRVQRLLVSPLTLFLNLCNHCSEFFGFYEFELFGKYAMKKFDEMKNSKTLCLQNFHVGVLATMRGLPYISNRQNILMVVLKSLEKMRDQYPSEKTIVSSSLLHLITVASQLVEDDPDQRLFAIVKSILDKGYYGPRITVLTLQLLKKILKRYIALALIEDDLSGLLKEVSYHQNLIAVISSISKSLLTNLKNQSSWEIRDTVLEVYQVMLEVEALIPGISRLVYDESLFRQVMILAAKDEAYIRASALNFFTAFVRAKGFLGNLSSKELIELAVKLLSEDEMPEPRTAACNLLAAMYVTDSLSEQGLPEKVYEAVFVASMKDLDWEVKKATLRFWQCVITKQLTDKGVPVDPVLLRFSNDSTKDVVVKIIEVMNKLGDLGCFKVLWSDVIDDSDISVSQEAANVIDNILDLDRKWNFSDKIMIDNDVEVDENNMSDKVLRPKEFFYNVSKNEWRETLEARKHWIENTCDDLSSLLDHILNPENSIENREQNQVDCY